MIPGVSRCFRVIQIFVARGSDLQQEGSFSVTLSIPPLALSSTCPLPSTASNFILKSGNLICYVKIIGSSQHSFLRFFLAITRGEEKIVLEQKSAYSLNSGKSPSQPAPQLAQIFSGTGAHCSPPSFYFFAKGSTLFCPLKVFHTSKVHICFANFCLLK